MTIEQFTLAEIVEAFEYLDDLRESGATNMFGAAAYIQEDLERTKNDARALLSAWMGSFDGDTPAHERAERVIKETA